MESLLRRPVQEKDFLLVKELSGPTVRKYYSQSLRLTIVISTNREACIKQLTSKAVPVINTIKFGNVTYYTATE